MAKKKTFSARKPEAATAPGAALKDRLDAATLSKLKAQAEALKEAEASRREERRRQEEAAREAERKRLENDFEYLLNQSGMDWKEFK